MNSVIVPEDLYVHDVEFHDEQDTTLNARPYPVSGIVEFDSIN